MRMIVYFVLGALFGIFLIKGGATSWFRMQEMFHFQGFQIFGIFLTAILVGALSVWLLKRFRVKTATGEVINFPQKSFHWGYVIGSALFGIGWGLTGACPGPLFVQIGAGILISVVMVLSALAGTWFYSLLRKKLLH